MRFGKVTRALFRHRVLGKSLGVWLVWAAVVTVLVLGPVMLTDPAIWPYLVDPELAALVAWIAVRYAWFGAALVVENALIQWRRRAHRHGASAAALGVGGSRFSRTSECACDDQDLPGQSETMKQMATGGY